MRAIMSLSGSFTMTVPSPARLGHARDLTGGREVAQGDTGQFQFAIARARTTGDLAAVADPDGRRVAGQFGQLQARFEALLQRAALVVGDRLEGVALRGVLRNEAFHLLVAVYGALLSHV